MSFRPFGWLRIRRSRAEAEAEEDGGPLVVATPNPQTLLPDPGSHDVYDERGLPILASSSQKKKTPPARAKPQRQDKYPGRRSYGRTPTATVAVPAQATQVVRRNPITNLWRLAFGRR